MLKRRQTQPRLGIHGASTPRALKRRRTQPRPGLRDCSDALSWPRRWAVCSHRGRLPPARPTTTCFRLWAYLTGACRTRPARVRFGLTPTHHSRLQSCPSTFNCVSTSSRSSDQYTAPWVAGPELKSAKAAADEIVEAVRILFPQAEQITAEEQPSGHYIRFHIAGRFSLPDEVEFLVRNEGVGDRNFSGDDGGGLLVTLRSVAGTVQCAFPCAFLSFALPDVPRGAPRRRIPFYDAHFRWRLAKVSPRKHS